MQKQMQAQLTGLGPSDPPAIANPSVKRRSCQIIFYTQFTLISILTIYLILWSQRQTHFRQEKWLPPILTAVIAAGISALAWQWLTMHHPSWILKAAFSLSPVLTCAVGLMFFHVRSETSHLLGISCICFTACQILHSCWVFSQLPYATSVIEESTEHVPPNVPRLVQLTILGATIYSCFLVCGIGGATALKTTPNMVYIGVILLSLTWTMLVAINAVQVLVSRLKYIHFTCGVQMGLVAICIDMIRHMMGSITFGSAMIPIFGLLRSAAKAITLLICRNDGARVSAALLKRANWWGLVHVGVQNMDFIQSSTHIWEHFHDAEMDMVIETDLTEVLCFFCGLTGGSVAALVAGLMALSFHRDYAIELSLFAAYIGYLMVKILRLDIPLMVIAKFNSFPFWFGALLQCRISLAWLQASIAAYYVAYADNTESPRISFLVPSRIDELKMHQPLLSKSTSEA